MPKAAPPAESVSLSWADMEKLPRGSIVLFGAPGVERPFQKTEHRVLMDGQVFQQWFGSHSASLNQDYVDRFAPGPTALLWAPAGDWGLR